MMPEILSVHSFTSESDISFNITDYSRLKYGDDKVADAFGKEMARKFIEHILGRLQAVPAPSHSPTTDSSTPFPRIAVATSKETLETAASRLPCHFTIYLDRWLAARGHSAAIELQIHRHKKSETATFTKDYGSLSIEDRQKRLDNDLFHLDTTLITRKTVIVVVDDCVVENLDLLDPTIEARLNEAAISPTLPPSFPGSPIIRADTFEGLKSVIVQSSGSFVLNQRLIKRLLKADHERFSRFLGFIQQMDPQSGSTLYDQAVKNGYHQVDEYQPIIRVLKVSPSPSW
ncbi:hypothetical protein V8F33_003464 [Rhypophila sp. PSN 637]